MSHLIGNRYRMIGKSAYKLVTELSYAVRVPIILDQFLRFLLLVVLSRHSRCPSSPTCLIVLVEGPRKSLRWTVGHAMKLQTTI
jgi:hypothetical protein